MLTQMMTKQSLNMKITDTESLKIYNTFKLIQINYKCDKLNFVAV